MRRDLLTSLCRLRVLCDWISIIKKASFSTFFFADQSGTNLVWNTIVAPMKSAMQPPHSSLSFMAACFSDYFPVTFLCQVNLPVVSWQAGKLAGMMENAVCSNLHAHKPGITDPCPHLGPAGVPDSQHGVWAGGAADQPGRRRTQDQQCDWGVWAGRSGGSGGHSSCPGSSCRASGEDSSSSPSAGFTLPCLTLTSLYALWIFFCTAVVWWSKGADCLTQAEQSITELYNSAQPDVLYLCFFPQLGFGHGTAAASYCTSDAGLLLAARQLPWWAPCHVHGPSQAANRVWGSLSNQKLVKHFPKDATVGSFLPAKANRSQRLSQGQSLGLACLPWDLDAKQHTSQPKARTLVYCDLAPL